MADSFQWRSFGAYLFDIDGTLVNARGGVHYNAFHTALREVYGCEGRIDDVPVHGNTDPGILRAALEQHGKLTCDFEARLPAARDIMCAEVKKKAVNMDVQLCPSIPDLLADLQSQGKLLGVVTGNLESIGWLKLEAAGVRQYFDFGCFSDHREKREDIFLAAVEKARELRGPETSVCFVGDTPNDIRAAASLGLPLIAVATGIYLAEELRRHNPTLCVGSCTDLLGMRRPGDKQQATDLQFRF
jgi:phosphoglycolate phosphatase